MEEYYFLFALAGAWMLFAAIHDFKTREVPNWLNFSLISVALAYRAFYSVINADTWFFVSGLMGFLIFVVLAFAFYYGKAFGGGDAKLLMGVGAILPFSNYEDIFLGGFTFIFLLFGVGAAYTFVYSLFLVRGRGKEIMHKVKVLDKSKKSIIFGSLLIGALVGVFLFFSTNSYIAVSFIILGISPLIYTYAKIVDEVCMVKKVDARKLREGDWLYEDVRVKGRVIKKTVHGLSKDEIAFLRKSGKKIVIRDGLPFTVNFFLALMVFFWLFFSDAAFFFGLF